MKKITVIFLFFFTLLLSVHVEVYARSGCCSHHGGVCGCRCCDGSSLSSTCAPYYPSCSSTKTYVAPTYKPVSSPTPKPTVYRPASSPPSAIKSSPSVKSGANYVEDNRSLSDSSGDLDLFSVGFWGFVIYNVYKWWKTKEKNE